ncbi:hypothetical protein [Haloarcula pellucida]|uniref:Uncharacterized protein n=1 Tax=Haloarcula pellucida TaxID=1427151 RepID=A0A830GMA4_9EURY|nr:hypothetical protein [Halomicroarcula pellucida]MBX0348349.1 hypothetical protein [Halomicroarcula pellucida]GGN98111.1 hypothetical protein GCM10009030_28170 [Halomicroarcula pellucida]
MGLDVLIISPCSGTKRFDAVIGPDEIDSRERTELLSEYPDAVASAAEMYTGREHEHIESAVQQLSEFANVDWRIVSAGFGVLSAGTEIPSYECTFSELEQVRQRAERMNLDVDTMTNNELVAAVSRAKNIPQDLRQILAEGYDSVFVALGTKYLIAVQEALASVPEETTAFAFASKGSKKFIGDCYWIPATEEERSRLGTTWIELRGRELLNLAQNIENQQQLGQMRENPEVSRQLNTPN